MLLELAVQNFALIDKLTVRFNEGLNILTGETGAGKSIIIDAVNMAIGERADKNYIRTGTDKATIQILFQCTNPELKSVLADQDIELEDCDTLILTREIYSNGRSVCRINDRAVTLSTLKEVSKYLIDIHGQHEHQSLLYPENHIEILDSFGDQEIIPLRKRIAEKYYILRKLNEKLKNLCGNDLERERKVDLLSFQINEIDQAKLRKDEVEQLTAEQLLLANSEKIHHTMAKAYEILYNGAEEYHSVLDGIGNIVSEIEHFKDLDKHIANIFLVLQECQYKIEDVSRDIRSYRDHIEFDPQALEQVEKRLDQINSLKRKYGKDIEEILSYRQIIFEELEEIRNSEAIAAELNQQIQVLQKELMDLSLSLRKNRMKIGKILEKRITEELVSLNMEKAAFRIDFIESVDKHGQVQLTAKGIDRVEFLISANAGEPLKPLSKIASGGEMSRIMLALKTILAKNDNIPTLIFDEIDTGISGRTANIVGEKLANISQTHQILCITHLPQIARMADTHFYIEKISKEDQTLTSVRELQKKERISELGRLLGGTKITDLTLKHAKEMLDSSIDYKKSIIS
ncbi:DNA replication and repair protein RecN [Geosporobacter subterraneus DSM 17957]|uniref:DNA repair protein RecN n=1 Tax=Geosporobacter subterraneus DSM 17957 TaxID=1121919 RepID=A0A1M6C4M8_9FIRM|nr:DNA repair protein RecN [Geosporobacter subterraneus]SHI55902.1 DNA replication and repair protein RecN [Geosporobacter subterraneus DSM 17957]